MSFKTYLLGLITLLFIACNHPKNETNNKSDDSIRNVKVKYMQQDVSLIRLIANPEVNKGREVRVMGYLNLEFEGDALYLNKSDYDQSISKNALWIQMSHDSLNMPDIKKCSKHYVLLEGTFNTMEGHMGMFSGSIENITRLEVYEGLPGPPRPPLRRKATMSFPPPVLK
jgi:hypothetical protein